jgi:predicted RNase H-like HicB family nuclease
VKIDKEIMRELLVYRDDDGKWTAECEEIPGYRVKGDTKEEVVEKIKSALLIYRPCKCED